MSKLDTVTADPEHILIAPWDRQDLILLLRYEIHDGMTVFIVVRGAPMLASWLDSDLNMNMSKLDGDRRYLGGDRLFL